MTVPEGSVERDYRGRWFTCGRIALDGPPPHHVAEWYVSVATTRVRYFLAVGSRRRPLRIWVRTARWDRARSLAVYP